MCHGRYELGRGVCWGPGADNVSRLLSSPRHTLAPPPHPAGDLGAIDAKYDVAASTACPSLDYIVVDTTSTAQRCVELLRQRQLGVATFLILEKQQHLAAAMQAKAAAPEGARVPGWGGNGGKPASWGRCLCAGNALYGRVLLLFTSAQCHIAHSILHRNPWPSPGPPQACRACLTWSSAATSGCGWPSTTPCATPWWRGTWTRRRASRTARTGAGGGWSRSRWVGGALANIDRSLGAGAPRARETSATIALLYKPS